MGMRGDERINRSESVYARLGNFLTCDSAELLLQAAFPYR